MSTTSHLIDYAYPCMMAEKALKDLHEAMLMKRYAEALKHAETALVEVRMTKIAIRHEMEQSSNERDRAGTSEVHSYR
jgi:hypothetical protein